MEYILCIYLCVHSLKIYSKPDKLYKLAVFINERDISENILPLVYAEVDEATLLRPCL